MNGQQHDTNEVGWSATAFIVKEHAKKAERPVNGSDPLAKSKPHEMADQIFDAFNELIQTSSGVVTRFHEAFIERSKVASLRESHPKFGLAYALTQLLWQSPPDAYFSFTRSASDKPVAVSPGFPEEFRDAVKCVANKYPRVLRMMMENHGRNREIPLRIFLGALLTLYAENVSVSAH
jgi:hypothetical protein